MLFLVFFFEKSSRHNGDLSGRTHNRNLPILSFSWYLKTKDIENILSVFSYHQAKAMFFAKKKRSRAAVKFCWLSSTTWV